MSRGANRLVVVDTETTGLPDEKSNEWIKQPGIVQLGAIVLDADLKEIAAFSSLVNPEIAGAAWQPDAIKTHGIEPSQVKDSPSFFGVFGEFSSFMTGADFWVGYNIKFDKTVLWHQLVKYGLEKNFPWPRNDIDVMHVAADHLNGKGKRGQKRWKLAEAYEAIVGKPMAGAHDALADVRGAAEILRVIGWPN